MKGPATLNTLNTCDIDDTNASNEDFPVITVLVKYASSDNGRVYEATREIAPNKTPDVTGDPLFSRSPRIRLQE